MNEYWVTVIFEPEINFNGANGRRYLKMQTHSDSEEEAKIAVKQMIEPLVKEGVTIICCI
ncbi:MAG: hypothetical protein RSF40_01650 [Oscillospiraceae bacterium]